MRLKKSSLIVLAAASFTSAVSFAAPACRDVFYYNPEVAALVSYDPVKQWLEWEQKSNFEIFRKSEAPVSVPTLSVDRASVNVTFLDSAPVELRALIQQGSAIRWFKHPFNTKSTIPHFHETSKSNLVTYFTASRSLAITLGDHVFTLKMPTDHPHGFEGQYQPSKATTQEDIMDGINRMSYVEKIDKKIGLDPKLILAKEVAMVADKATGEGYLFRDISFMNDGNYYLPALSIPYAGRKIAALNKQHPDTFWSKNYAELLGSAKAKLLLRYGLQMETPNSQNMLIQLDHDLRPTGVIVFRDISDTVLIEGVAKGLGEGSTLKRDAEIGVENSTEIQPYWSNSAWRFDEAGKDSFDETTLSSWGKVHDQAYRREIARALGLDLSQFAKIDKNAAFDAFMSSEIVQAKLKAYRQKLEQKETQKNSTKEQHAS